MYTFYVHYLISIELNDSLKDLWEETSYSPKDSSYISYQELFQSTYYHIPIIRAVVK